MGVTMLFRSAGVGLVAAGSLALLVQVAHADSPVETAIKGWVASVDASPGWQATYKDLTYDAASNRAVLTGLALHNKPAGLDVSFGAVGLTGFAAAADGGFTASRITVDEGSLDVGVFKIGVSDVELNTLAMPALPALAWDPQHPFTSLVRAYAPFSRLSLTSGLIGSLGIIANNAGADSRIVYHQFRIDRWADGKIAAITAGPLTMEAPNPDGLMAMSVASVETRNIDIDAALRVFDPDRYAGGVGDGVWHTVSGLTAYHDFVVAAPGAKLTMKLVSLQDLKLRQPQHSFAGYLDQALADPNAPTSSTDTAKAAVEMASAYGIGRFGVSGLDIAAAGMDGLHLGGFNISDLSMERLGQFALDDFSTSFPDVGSFKLAHFAVGNVVLPGADAWLQAIDAGATGSGGNRLVPKPGFVEMSGLAFALANTPPITLDTLRIDMGDYVGPVATSMSADVGGLVLPVSALPPGARATFQKLGYDPLTLACRLKAKWNPADETVAVDRLAVDLKGGGGLDLSMRLGGLPRSALENPKTLSAELPNLTLKSATLTLKDDSIVGKGLDLLAEKMHAPPDRFRQQFAEAMPLILSLFVLHDPKVAALVRQSGILAKLAPVVKAFVAAPGSSVTVTLAPPAPVAFSAISAAVDSEPASLLTMLGLTATSSAAPVDSGASPAAPAPSAPDKAAPVGGDMRPSTPAQ